MSVTPLTALPGRVSLGLLGLMFCVPFLYYYHYYPIPSFYEEALAFGLGLLAALRLGWAPSRPAQIPQTVLWLLAFALLLFLQLVIGQIAYFEQSLIGILYVFWAAALVWLGSELRAEFGLERVCEVLAWALFAGGMLNGLAGYVQSFQIETFFSGIVSPLTPPWRTWGNLNLSNLFADYMSLALLSLAYLTLTRRLSAGLACVLALFMVFPLSLSGARMIWLFLGVTLAWTTVCACRRMEGFGRAMLCAGFLLIAYASCIALALALDFHIAGQGVDDVAARRALELSIYSDRPGQGQSTRLYLWTHAIHMFLEAPLLGVGFGEFAWNFFRQAERVTGFGVPGLDRNAHNMILQLLAETGVAGTTAIVGALGVWFWRLLRHPINAQVWWIVACLVVLGVHSMLEFPMWEANFLGIAAMLLGLGETARFRSSLGKILPASGFLIVAFGLVGLSSIVKDYREMVGWLYSRERLSSDSAEVLVRQQEALLALQANSVFSPYIELAYATTIVADRQNLPDKLDLIGRVMRFSPTSPVAFRYVLLLALDGQGPAAEANLRRVLVLYPGRLPEFAPVLERLAARDPAVFGSLAQIALGNPKKR